MKVNNDVHYSVNFYLSILNNDFDKCLLHLLDSYLFKKIKNYIMIA